MHSWYAKVPLPEEILAALHCHHPSAHLCVSARQSYLAALSSPQLRQLSISIPCSDTTNPDSFTLFEQLGRTVIQSHRLRALAIDFYQDFDLHQKAKTREEELKTLVPLSCSALKLGSLSGTPFSHFPVVSDMLYSSDTIAKVQIPLKPTDRLPPLEELEIKARTYIFDRLHCDLLHQCMDWTKLTRLRLGSPETKTFFEAFAGKVPRLEHLDFSYHSRTRMFYPFTEQVPLKECSAFLSPLHTLKSLIIRCDMIDVWHGFWNDLAVTHGKHLQYLALKPRSGTLGAPTFRDSPATYLNYLYSFTKLKTLDLALAIPSQSDTCDNCSEPIHKLVNQ
jgi:hypothetical protein